MSWATRYARIQAEREAPRRERQRAAYVATQAEPVLTAVVVERLPFGASSFSQCVADVEEPDTLTVSCTDAAYDKTYGPLHIFRPGSWAHATTFDALGNVLTAFTSQAGKERQQADAARDAAAMQRTT